MDVEQDDIGRLLGQPNHRLQAVGGGIDVEAAGAQAAGQQFALVVVVFDDECPVMNDRNGRIDFAGAGASSSFSIALSSLKILKIVASASDMSPVSTFRCRRWRPSAAAFSRFRMSWVSFAAAVLVGCRKL